MDNNLGNNDRRKIGGCSNLWNDSTSGLQRLISLTDVGWCGIVDIWSPVLACVCPVQYLKTESVRGAWHRQYLLCWTRRWAGVWCSQCHIYRYTKTDLFNLLVLSSAVSNDRSVRGACHRQYLLCWTQRWARIWCSQWHLWLIQILNQSPKTEHPQIKRNQIKEDRQA